MAVEDEHLLDLLVKANVAQLQLDAEATAPKPIDPPATPGGDGRGTLADDVDGIPVPDPMPLTRFHGTAVLNTTRVGRDASQIADEVIAHLSGLVGANVVVTIEIEAEIPDGAPDQVVRTVTENSRTLKFTSHGFEKE